MILKDPPFFIYKICQRIVLYLPVQVGYKIALVAAEIYRLFHCGVYKIVQKNLQVIFPEKDKKEIIKYSRETFRNFAKYLVDFLYFPILDREYIEKNIKVEGIENFNRALSKKQGIITITAHLGSWEMGGAVAAILGYPINAIALEHSNKRVQNFFFRQREKKGIKVIFQKDAARKTLFALRKKEIVAFVSDKDYFGSGIKINFFSREVSMPRGAAVFAVKTKALIVPGFMLREDNQLKFIVEKPLSYQLSGDEKRDVQEITQKIIDIIEKYIRKYPGQWFYFEKL
ncbi:MAG: hypothetical protein KAS87_04480 [Candidatus Omnitrophica bacterium]|nr:hypothetical protein [Candidatus Omnitrophota bacterium]